MQVGAGWEDPCTPSSKISNPQPIIAVGVRLCREVIVTDPKLPVLGWLSGSKAYERLLVPHHERRLPRDVYLKGRVTSLSSPHISSQVDHPNRRLSTPGDTLGNPFNFCHPCPSIHCCCELFYPGYRFLMDCSSHQQGRTLESLDPGIQLPVLSSSSSILRPCSQAVSLSAVAHRVILKPREGCDHSEPSKWSDFFNGRD